MESGEEAQRLYDQVAVKVTQGGYNVLHIGEWEKIAIEKRVSLIREGKVTFLLEGRVADLGGV